MVAIYALLVYLLIVLFYWLLFTIFCVLIPYVWSRAVREKAHQVLLCCRRVDGCAFSEIALFLRNQDKIVHEIARVAVTRPLDRETQEKLHKTRLGSLWWPGFNVEYPAATWGEMRVGLALDFISREQGSSNSADIVKERRPVPTTDAPTQIWDPVSKRWLEYAVNECKCQEENPSAGEEEQSVSPQNGEQEEPVCLIV